MEPVLQVALDHMHLKRALLAATEAAEGGADWLEAGTPLIKSEGIEVVRQLKKSFPGKTIVADLKTMDTGAFEVEIAVKAGADVVTDDATILEAVKAARRYGAKIMVDLMRVADKPTRAKELEALGVDYLNMHVSIDEQMIAQSPLQELKAVEKAMKTRKAIPTGLFKKYTDADVVEAFRKVSTPNLADAMQKRGVITGLVPRIRHGTKLVGRALTVKTADGDWAKPVEAIDRAKPGDVIVIDVGGRDLDTILELNFPCFSRHVAPHAGEPKGLGEIGGEIECGGQKVRTGDWIVGDESGLIVVAREQAVEMANRALDVLERENRIREEIRRGGTLSSVLELEKWEQIR